MKTHLDDDERPQVWPLVLCTSGILHRKSLQTLFSPPKIWLGLGNMANLELLHLGATRKEEKQSKMHMLGLLLVTT